MKHLTTMAAVAALIGLPMAQAHASSASVHMSKLTFSVIDLLPNDGVAPSFQFLANDHLVTRAHSNGPHEFIQDKTVDGLFTDLSYSPGSSISQGQVTVGHNSMDVTSTVNSTGDYSVTVSGYTGRNIDAYYPMLRVGAGTGLVVSATLEMSADASCGANALRCNSNAQFYLTVDDQSVLKHVADGSFATGPSTFSGFAGLVYTNFASVQRDIMFSATAQTYLMSDTTAVPEPSSYALVLGGALAVAGLRRRRAQA